MLLKKEKRVYFGMTKCKISEKIKEHHRDFKQAISYFYMDNKGRYVNFEEVKIIVPCVNPFKRMIEESVKIIAHE